jgi:hypothetical protein
MYLPVDTQAEEKAHTDVNAKGYKMVVEPIETFIKHARESHVLF